VTTTVTHLPPLRERWGRTKAELDDSSQAASLESAVDLHTFVRKLPVLDAAESWSYDASADCFATDATQTTRTKKIPRNHVKAEATEKHPAQVEVYYEDVPVGYWTTVKFSGALPARRVNELLDRVEKLQQSVKFAREEANNTEVTDQRVGDAVFGYLFR